MNNGRKMMTVTDLLQWAYEENQVADGLERLLPDMPEGVRESMRGQIESHRDRAWWLDRQVQYHLERADEDGGA